MVAAVNAPACSPDSPGTSAPGVPSSSRRTDDYDGNDVVMARITPRSIRFDAEVDSHLRAYLAARPGLSASAAANRVVDEGLRMVDHPAIVFRDGPTGRRAVVVGGPDVWEIVRAVKSARAHESELDSDETVALVVANTGASARQVRAAIRYWSQFPDEIDAQIELADEAEQQALDAWRREQDLLTR